MTLKAHDQRESLALKNAENEPATPATTRLPNDLESIGL